MTISDAKTASGLKDRLAPVVEKYRGKEGAAIPLLADVQREMGYVAEEAVEHVGAELGIPPAELFGVASFYAMFRFQPEGKYVVRLCRGTACHVQGSGLIADQLERVLGIKDGETTQDMMFTLQCVACLGCCSLAPVMMVGDDVHGRLTPEKAAGVLDALKLREARE
ncbi:MAG: NADH-quinone oxidoreductase subunit NuoE [Synergistaceae bacterium]|nr:NADH-quinone oxidoreductase subunit NuoE [Synergistaceae bacterium]